MYGSACRAAGLCFLCKAMILLCPRAEPQAPLPMFSECFRCVECHNLHCCFSLRGISMSIGPFFELANSKFDGVLVAVVLLEPGQLSLLNYLAVSK